MEERGQAHEGEWKADGEAKVEQQLRKGPRVNAQQVQQLMRRTERVEQQLRKLHSHKDYVV